MYIYLSMNIFCFDRIVRSICRNALILSFSFGKLQFKAISNSATHKWRVNEASLSNERIK